MRTNTTTTKRRRTVAHGKATARELALGGYYRLADAVLGNATTALYRQHGAYIVARSPMHPSGHAMETHRTLREARKAQRRLQSEWPAPTPAKPTTGPPVGVTGPCTIAMLLEASTRTELHHVQGMEGQKISVALFHDNGDGTTTLQGTVLGSLERITRIDGAPMVYFLASTSGLGFVVHRFKAEGMRPSQFWIQQGHGIRPKEGR